MNETIGQFILDRLLPHECTVEHCGLGSTPIEVAFSFRKHHIGCFELSSDDFIEATKMTPKRYGSTPVAPD